jgi:excisionase family DNA binding protein
MKTTDEKPNQFPELLSVDELAALFNVSKTTIYRMVESRLILFYRVGRFLRFSTDDMLAYLKSQRVKSKHEWFYEASHKSHPGYKKTITKR